ncbi:uncharacterized protein LOC127811045 [Diospyros lotus]|uniref:uncharacterized protein LOC127811045 n=1 Tax=Diospyros lotus TaxID=55363 RepID=UPI002259A342|nr:uncharacterized protein LOC127811045 [Diospyros lotus]
MGSSVADSKTTTTSSAPSTASSSSSLLIEINVISAQDLAAISKSMRTYAIVWLEPALERKLSTHVDSQGHSNPTWNDKFAFQVDNDFLLSDDSAVMVEIYAASTWFRNNLVGTVRVLITDLIHPSRNIFGGTRFVALQVRRASGSPQGILNMGVSLHNGASVDSDGKAHQLVRHNFSSLTLEDYLPPINGSMVNGSAVNGSELCSDVGPSASIVAAAIASKGSPCRAVNPTTTVEATDQERGLGMVQNDVNAEDTGSSILEDLTVEQAMAKGYRTRTLERWRMELQPLRSSGEEEEEEEVEMRLARRHSDGGLFSCMAVGIEFTIVCGANNNKTNNHLRNKKRSAGYNKPIVKRSPSHQNLSSYS